MAASQQTLVQRMNANIFQKFRVDYSLVGRRDGLAMREPDHSLWRKNDYRRGYADGLIEAAKRIAGTNIFHKPEKQDFDALYCPQVQQS